MILYRAEVRKHFLSLAEVWVGVILMLAASLSILLTRIEGGIALLWPASAVTAALLVRLRNLRWLIACTSILVGLSLANVLAGHRPTPIANFFTLINFLEIVGMVVAFRHIWRFAYPKISINEAALMTVVMGIVIPGFAACLGGLFLARAYGTPLVTGITDWWSAHTIGACLVGPPIILYSAQGLKRLLRRGFVIENSMIFLGCFAGCYLTIRYVRFPFVTIGLLLLMASFRMGAFGTSILSLSTGVLITNLWAFGMRPLGLDPTPVITGTLVGLPVIALIATLLPPIAVGLGTDARRTAAKALGASERRFRESMEHSPIGMLIANLDGSWRYSNRALQHMLGYTADELKTMPPGGPSKAEQWKESGPLLNKLLAGEVSVYDFSRQYRHRDGHWIWAHVAVSLLRDAEGSPVHLIAQVESLEARRQAEEMLASERERLRITLASINDAVITVDADTRVTYINAAAEELLATDLQAIANRRIDEVIHLIDPDTSKNAANLVGLSACHGKVFKREQACWLHRPDGSICYITDTVSPVISEAGVLTGLVIVLRDTSADVERSRDLHYRAMHDPLTGLSNRAEFDERLRSIFQRAAITETSAAVIAIDLDRFKAINDLAGHAAGDAVLCKVADLCRKAVRTSDTVARVGGDEFVIILDNCSEDRATLIANQLLAALNPVTIDWGPTKHGVNASLGLAMCTAMQNEKSWINAADQACFAAKKHGRARLSVAPTPESISSDVTPFLVA